jgi:hypothetical protein
MDGNETFYASYVILCTHSIRYYVNPVILWAQLNIPHTCHLDSIRCGGGSRQL